MTPEERQSILDYVNAAPRAVCLEGCSHIPTIVLRLVEFAWWAVSGKCVECESLASLTAELARLQSLEAKLPKTADGVGVIPGMSLFHNRYHGIEFGAFCFRRINGRWGIVATWHDIFLPLDGCYSTREAAENARDSNKR